ncbi:MAG: hypothetical protein QGG64_29730 [Candidatus Latescibacteria bacterium]|jgi:hypothetical protein|nr:hypothetical protein [Candidatus Latescibacterota bacterium]
MQTLKEIFRREDERLNLLNGAIVIFIVVSFIILAFALSEMRFGALDTSSQKDAPAPSQDSGNND